jgi:hypothetical protein
MAISTKLLTDSATELLKTMKRSEEAKCPLNETSFSFSSAHIITDKGIFPVL